MTNLDLLQQLRTWSATASWTDVATTTLAWAAVVVAAYLAVVTVLYALALAVRAPRAADRLGALTPALLRGVVRRLVAAALVTSTWAPAGTALAAVPPPGLRVPTATREAPALDLPTTGDELPAPVVADPGPATIPAPRRTVPAPSPATPARAATVTVRAGDHLWSIAARHLGDHRGVPAAALPVADVAAYWAEVVRLNAPRLPSRDPDLVRPGDEVRLPPPT